MTPAGPRPAQDPEDPKGPSCSVGWASGSDDACVGEVVEPSNTALIGSGDVVDPSRDVLLEVWRPGTADPIAVHVRPELLDRLRRSSAARPPHDRRPVPLRPPVPVVADDAIPRHPGFEVHRAAPGPHPRRDPDRAAGHRRQAGGRSR